MTSPSDETWDVDEFWDSLLLRSGRLLPDLLPRPRLGVSVSSASSAQLNFGIVGMGLVGDDASLWGEALETSSQDSTLSPNFSTSIGSTAMEALT